MNDLNISIDSKKTSSNNFGNNINGVNNADLGKYSEALKYFSKAIEDDPTNFVSYFNRASIKMIIGDIEGARQDFNKAQYLDPKNNLYS